MHKELRQEPLSRSAAGIRFDTTALATDGKKKMPFGAACGGEIRLVYGRRRRRTTVAILVMGSAHPFTELLFGADEAIPALLAERGVAWTDLEGWHRLDAHEIALGAAQDRARVKVVPREEMVRVSRAE